VKTIAIKPGFILTALLWMCAACTPVLTDTRVSALPSGSATPPSESQIPVTGGDSMQRGDVKIDSLDILVSDSFPPEYHLDVKGSLPSSCHELRTTVDRPTFENKIQVRVFSIYDPYAVCAQAAKNFQASIPLGSYIRDSRQVFVNDVEIGEIIP
jgi:hypothetical protein